MTCKQNLETYLGIGRSKLRILGEKGEKPESFCAELMTGRSSVLQACSHSSYWNLHASACRRKLKRTCPVSAPFSFCSGLSGTNPNFVKCLFQLV
ncbi:hypothetical protein MTR_7g014940 [Medicago truncatula]|uniref:Uncharacterized protein n=1 Tax=Medicago truncatula TaxID=3880 RepID=A0A072TVZ1_MEDTR|nr:hypothetical protein MTR_7g014940 [Medicago truncatula]